MRPFVNKGIYRIIEELLGIKNLLSIVIYTNGMVPVKEEHVELLQDPKVHFSVTDYSNIGKNIEKTKFLAVNNISHRVHPPESWTDSGRIQNFYRSEEELKTLSQSAAAKIFTL